MAILGVPTIAFILYSLAFGFGLAFIPLIAWTAGPALPYFISEPLANLLFLVSNIGLRKGLFIQRETDEYEIKRAGEGYEPQSYWTRWAGTQFGLTFEATKEAFEPALVDEEHEQELSSLFYSDDGIAPVGIDRGGKGVTWYAHKSDIDKILVPIGQKLAELRDAAGPEMGIDAYAEALKDYGGDTSDYSNKMMIGSSAIFVAMGLGMGYIVFF